MATHKHPGVTVRPTSSGAGIIEGAPTSIAAFVGFFAQGDVAVPRRVRSVKEFDEAFGPPSRTHSAGYSVHQFFTNGGQDAYIIRVAQPAQKSSHAVASELIGRPKPRSGVFALDGIDLFNTLCIPDSVNLETNPQGRLLKRAASFCASRRAFFIADPPGTATSAQAMERWITHHANWRHRNAAVYFPHVLVADHEDPSRSQRVGASGTIAGLYARTDARRGVFKAAAGRNADLRGVEGLTSSLTNPENEGLSELGVNCLRTIHPHGILSWGSRTSVGRRGSHTEWRYVPVRRLALFVEESIHRGLQWAVFEPNDEPLWALIRERVNGFLDTLFRRGAFTGATARESYFVRCGRDTTTAADLAQGIVNVQIGIAPLRPAEFIVLTLGQRTRPSS